MGLWSSLCNVAKSVAKGIGTAAAFTVGVPLAVGVWAAEKAGLISTEVSETEALTDSSSARQVENVSDILYKYRDMYENTAEEFENQCQRLVNEYFDSLVKELQQREVIVESAGMDRLKRRQRELSRNIQGSLTEPIGMRLSLDNADCRTILEMSNGSEKRRQMDIYANRVLRDAKKNLEKTTCETIQNQWDETAIFLKEYMKNREQEAERQKKLLEQWEKDMESDNFNRENARLIPSVKLYAFEQVEKIIEA